MSVLLHNTQEPAGLDADHPLPLLKAAADPLRLDVLQVLGYSSFAVLELCDILSIRQSGLSHHLKVLAQAGLVETRREGTTIFYRRRLPGVGSANAALHRALSARLDGQPLRADVARRLADIQQARAARSQLFFERQIGAIETGHEFIADFAHYGELAAEMVRRALPEGGDEALEVGPGDGDFLLLLKDHFVSLTGMDNAEAMRALASKRIAETGATNVRLLAGNWPEAAPPRQFDALIFNMVLHHLPSPRQSLIAAGRRLRPGGVLLITELCRHDQHWTRDRCGDLWLGFDESELQDWTACAGLVPQESQFLALRNGFQIQARTFTRLDDNVSLEMYAHE